MRGYEKGTDVAVEIATMRSAFIRAVAAIEASPDAEQAFRDASALGDLAKRLESESAGFRELTAARLADERGMSAGQVAKLLGMSRSRAAQLIAAGRSKENPVTDPGTEPEPASVQAAAPQTTVADTGEPEESDAELDARIAGIINKAK